MNTFTGGIALAIVLALSALVWSESPCELPDGSIGQECAP